MVSLNVLAAARRFNNKLTMRGPDAGVGGRVCLRELWLMPRTSEIFWLKNAVGQYLVQTHGVFGQCPVKML